MRVGTFCSGICAPEVAWRGLGWEPQFFSEIEPFPIAVQRHHFPNVPNLGDMERISDDVLARYPVDLVCAGTPCQAFSVAGLRKGLADPRGNLTLVFLRLLDQLRPAWVVWENVPGVLSNDGGRAFGAFLGGLGQLGYGFAYRVLDAQHFGVPQRRRRVFVVGHLGDWRRAAAVLFERHSMSGHPAPSREAGTRVTSSLTGGFGNGGADDNRAQAGWLIPSGSELAGTLSCAYAKQSHNGMVEMENGLVTHALRGEGFDASEDGTGRGTPLVPDVYPCLHGGNQYNNSDPGMEAKMLIPVAFTDLRGRGTEIRVNGDKAEALHCAKGMSEQQCIAFQERGREGGRNLELQPELAYSLNAPNGGGRRQENNVCAHSGVRRLTPRECERLQGFPDDFTLVPFRGKPAADGPRYRAIGNSMAVPVMSWLGKRIQMVEAIPK